MRTLAITASVTKQKGDLMSEGDMAILEELRRLNQQVAVLVAALGQPPSVTMNLKTEPGVGSPPWDLARVIHSK